MNAIVQSMRIAFVACCYTLLSSTTLASDKPAQQAVSTNPLGFANASIIWVDNQLIQASVGARVVRHNEPPNKYSIMAVGPLRPMALTDEEIKDGRAQQKALLDAMADNLPVMLRAKLTERGVGKGTEVYIELKPTKVDAFLYNETTVQLTATIKDKSLEFALWSTKLEHKSAAKRPSEGLEQVIEKLVAQMVRAGWLRP